jgi:hypothetical protein
MKKSLLLLLLLFFLWIDSSSQDFILIKHIGPSDKYLPALMINMKEMTEIKLFNYDSICHTFTGRLTCDNIELDSIRYQRFKKLMMNTIASTSATARVGYTDFRIIIVSGKKKKYLYTSNKRSVAFFTELSKRVEQKTLDSDLLIKVRYILKYLQL